LNHKKSWSLLFGISLKFQCGGGTANNKDEKQFKKQQKGWDTKNTHNEKLNKMSKRT